MNSFVPIWDMEDNYRSFHSLLPAANQRKSMRADQELLELVWQNGHVVMQNQSNRAGNCSEFKQASKPEAPPKCGGNFGSADTFIHEEEETAPWLQYPLDDDPLDGDLCSNLFYANEMFASDPHVTKETNRVHVEESAMPPPKPQSAAAAADGGGGVVNFAHFSRSKKVDTPCVSRRSGGKGIENGSQREVGESSSMGTKLSTNFSSGVSDAVPRQVEGVHAATLTSSSAGSGSSVGRTCPNTTSSQSRKRKGGDAEESECQSEETEFQSADAAKAPQRQRSAASARRSRAAEVHNLSERRRRDRINEKMKALQDLIPHCNKTDKASMLDEAIEYLKSLQLQVQMMWMGNGMAPMMFPSPQHYLSLIGRGMSHGSTMPSAPSAVQMPRAPVPNQSMSSATGTNQATLNPIHLLNQMQSSSVPDAYARYLGFHQMQQPPQGMSMFNPYGSQLIQTNHSAVTTETNHLPNNGNSPSDATQRGKTG